MKPVLCIPSYSRPEGIAIQRCKDLPLQKYIFIRREQLELYEKWKPWYTLVLQNRGTDIGLVRKNIVSYCHKKGIDWAFMLDDDISKVETLGKKEDSTVTSNRIIAGVPGPRMEPLAFKTWYQTAKKEGLVLSSPNHRAYDRFQHGMLQVNRSACIQCILLDIEAAHSVGNYRSLHETGNEDYYMQYLLMKQGLLTGKVGSIEYDCPAVGVGEGGNNVDEYTDLNKRYEVYVNTFLKNVCNDSSLIRVKTTQTGQKSVAFVWKNWSGFTKELSLVGKDLYV